MLTQPPVSSARQAPSLTDPGAFERLAYPALLDIDSLDQLHQFRPISLAEMDGVALRDRTDTKYVLPTHQLHRTLEAMTDRYRILDVAGVRVHHYQSLYFDSADFALYMSHHNGRRDRYKVRSRNYVDTGLSFLEVKLKTHKDRTIKHRIQTQSLVSQLTPETRAFVDAHCPLGAHRLGPIHWNAFRRITLVSTQALERVTLDVDLRYSAGEHEVSLPGLVIAEVKQAEHSRHSAFIRLMHDNHVHPMGLSKYCLGVISLFTTVKYNNFKAKHLLLVKLMRGDVGATF
jgi:hypothetical protein